jgi:hypothetical protein
VKLEEERRTVRAAERKFFTVGEDQQILAVLKSLGASKTSREIAETISKKMSHSVESIRDRIKRFLTRIRPVDEAYIAEEAKVRFDRFFHPLNLSKRLEQLAPLRALHEGELEGEADGVAHRGEPAEGGWEHAEQPREEGEHEGHVSPAQDRRG